jgi:hypothetical protein
MALVGTIHPEACGFDAQQPFRARTAIAFESPVDPHTGIFPRGQFRHHYTGTELLTPGISYTAEEIEAMMRTQNSEVARISHSLHIEIGD